MHISGWGSNSGGGLHKERQRSSAFQGRHRVGERVTGRVLKRERPGYAWVDFEGLELLTNIESDPEPGSLLLFQIIRLEPDILLQELHVARAQGDPLGPAVDLFWAARTRFETISAGLRKELSDLPGPEQPRKDAFDALLAGTPDLAQGFKQVTQACTAINTLLSARGAGQLDYRPWLLPEALSGELLSISRTRTNPASEQSPTIVETGFSFTLPPHGQCEMRLLASPPTITVRLFLEHPGLGPAFERLIRAFLFAGQDVDFFTPSVLPPEARAGVLAPQLSMDRARSRFARRV